MPIAQTPHGPLRSFGRVKSRALKPRQAAMLADRLPALMLPDPAAGPIDPAGLMAGAAEADLQPDLGGGEHLAGQAARRPDVLMLGIEPFLNGVASCVRHIDEQGLANVRLIQDDARALIAALLGFTSIAGAAMGVAKILFFVFLVLFLVSIVMHFVRGRPSL